MLYFHINSMNWNESGKTEERRREKGRERERREKKKREREEKKRERERKGRISLENIFWKRIKWMARLNIITWIDLMESIQINWLQIIECFLLIIWNTLSPLELTICQMNEPFQTKTKREQDEHRPCSIYLQIKTQFMINPAIDGTGLRSKAQQITNETRRISACWKYLPILNRLRSQLWFSII